jgi:hypothetical protein
MGSEERGVSIYFATLRACAHRFEVLNEIALPLVPTGTVRFTHAGEFLSGSPPLTVCSGCGAASRRDRLFAEVELGAVAPHAMQDDGELAGDRDAGAGQAAALGDLQTPGAQAGPFTAGFGTGWTPACSTS